MKFFNIFKNIFKKNTKTSSSDYLSLEDLLQRAKIEPAYRREFYKRLLSDNLFFIIRANDLQSGKYILKKEQRISIVSHLDGKIPIFTSPERIFDRGIVKRGSKFLEMSGKDFFEATKDDTLLLNPYSDYHKELFPHEIEALLNGTILIDPCTIKITHGSTTWLTSQPVKYPTDIVNSLKQLFSKKPQVEAAYLSWITDPESADRPYYLFLIKCDNDTENVINETLSTARKILSPCDRVDVIGIEHKAFLDDYAIQDAIQFYEKK